LSTRYLEALCHPNSIVVIGASERTLNLGGVVLRNIQSGGFQGKLMVVNRKGYDRVHDVECVKKISQLPFRPDMAIVCTPPTTVPSIVLQLGQLNVRVAIILTGGLSRIYSHSGRPLICSIQERAQKSGLRILGPETTGIIVPHHHLNATFMHMGISPGKIAYIGQSTAVTNAIIDWAVSRGIGFSYMTTLGEGVDIQLEDLIDYFSQDRKTRAILLHIESISSPRRYISAVRAVSRGKPVIAVKSGRFPESQGKPMELPAGCADGDKIYDAVLKRAGVLRVNGADEMIDAMETLTRMKTVFGETLHIVSNGLGPSVLAADRLLSLGGEIGQLDSATIDKLSEHLPAYWTRRNPIDLDYTAGPALFKTVLEILSQDLRVCNVLVLFAPAINEDSLQVADAVIQFSKKTHLNVLTCWMGKSSAQESKDAFYVNGVPSYTTPDKAVKALMYMINHQRSQKVLRQTPVSYKDPNVNHLRLKKTVNNVFQSGRRFLSNEEVRNILLEYEMPLLDTFYCETVEDVVATADSIGKPVTVRVLHTEGGMPYRGEYTNKGRFRGRVKGVLGETKVRQACQNLIERYPLFYPDSHFMGYAVQASFPFSGGVGFSIGVTRDPLFGPLIVCGAAGVGFSVVKDRFIALPPLNMVLARDLLNQTQMMTILKSQSYHPAQDINKFCEILVVLSRITVDLPQIKNLEIVPFYFEKDGPVAVNAAIELGEPVPSAILPYPQELKEWIMLPVSKRKVELRPVRGEDEPAHNEFVGSLSPETIRYRFFHYRKSFTHDDLVQMLQIDYDREMAFIACELVQAENRANIQAENGDDSVESTKPVSAKLKASENGVKYLGTGDHLPAASKPAREMTLGVVRAWTDSDNLQCEFAIVIRDDVKGEGLGWIMMRKIIEYCRERGTVEMIGSVLPDNKPMIVLAQKLGFAVKYDEDEEVMALKLPLNQPDEWQAERLKAV